MVSRQDVRIGFCRERQRCVTKRRHDYRTGRLVRATTANIDSCTFLGPTIHDNLADVDRPNGVGFFRLRSIFSLEIQDQICLRSS